MALYFDQNYFHCFSINFGCFTMQLHVITIQTMFNNRMRKDINRHECIAMAKGLSKFSCRIMDCFMES